MSVKKRGLRDPMGWHSAPRQFYCTTCSAQKLSLPRNPQAQELHPFPFPWLIIKGCLDRKVCLLKSPPRITLLTIDKWVIHKYVKIHILFFCKNESQCDGDKYMYNHWGCSNSIKLFSKPYKSYRKRLGNFISPVT